ncbi:unnamed protein product [Amoebophrya sp. A120]|nr:unnamed protein product [Amoebophrya sp. A120]|eukprot:GSA120T00018360001.1
MLCKSSALAQMAALQHYRSVKLRQSPAIPRNCRYRWQRTRPTIFSTPWTSWGNRWRIRQTACRGWQRSSWRHFCRGSQCVISETQTTRAVMPKRNFRFINLYCPVRLKKR